MPAWEIGHVAGQGAADQELHREVVGPLGILLVVRLLRAQPPQGEYVAERPRYSLIPFPMRRQVRIDRIVEDKVPVIQRIGVAVKPYGTVLDEIGMHTDRTPCAYRWCAKRIIMSRKNDNLMSGLAGRALAHSCE